MVVIGKIMLKYTIFYLKNYGFPEPTDINVVCVKKVFSELLNKTNLIKIFIELKVINASNLILLSYNNNI